MGWAYLEFKDDCIGLGDTAAEDFNHEIRLIISELMDILLLFSFHVINPFVVTS